MHRKLEKEESTKWICYWHWHSHEQKLPATGKFVNNLILFTDYRLRNFDARQKKKKTTDKM